MDRQPVISSNILTVGYSGEHQILEVEFKSKQLYRYLGVSPKVYEALVQAPSLGSYLSQNIKGVYEYKQVEEGEPLPPSREWSEQERKAFENRTATTQLSDGSFVSAPNGLTMDPGFIKIAEQMATVFKERIAEGEPPKTEFIVGRSAADPSRLDLTAVPGLAVIGEGEGEKAGEDSKDAEAR